MVRGLCPRSVWWQTVMVLDFSQPCLGQAIFASLLPLLSHPPVPDPCLAAAGYKGGIIIPILRDKSLRQQLGESWPSHDDASGVHTLTLGPCNTPAGPADAASQSCRLCSSQPAAAERALRVPPSSILGSGGRWRLSKAGKQPSSARQCASKCQWSWRDATGSLQRSSAAHQWQR